MNTNLPKLFSINVCIIQFIIKIGFRVWGLGFRSITVLQSPHTLQHIPKICRMGS